MTAADPTPTPRKPKKPDTAGAKILAAGASVAGGIGLIGAMVTGAAAAPQAQAPTPASRIIVIQQAPQSPATNPGFALPDGMATPAGTPDESASDPIVVVRTQTTPVTVSEGS